MASYSYTFTSGDSVTPTKLNAARTVSEIVNADINASAAIAGTKITPNFGSQNVVTTGDAGIGTSSPSSSAGRCLHVFNNANTGTVSSNARLLVESQNRNAIIEVAGASTSTNGIVFGATPGGSPWAAVLSDPSQNIFFRTGGTTERMRIDASGNVGIGTTSTKSGGYLNVLAGLTVHANTGQESYLQLFNGNAGANLKTWRIGGYSNGGFQVETVDDAYSVAIARVAITSAGNFGIATTTPSSRLHVEGDLTMSSATTTAGAGAVVGYLVVNINGTSRKIPVHAS